MRLDQKRDTILQQALIMTLVSDVGVAAKIVKSAQNHHLQIRNFDRAQKLNHSAQEKKPSMVILDLDTREADAFEVLKAFRGNADLSHVPVVGFVSKVKEALKREAEAAGCLRVFFRTDFFAGLSDLWIRYLS
ncbi:MAG: hypothetical protein H6757_02095 [Candidatus Omnitrophica bacterium]|nr:hypothetical protein [Candidatus Omnitrophota bacterium]